jgi:hypothetical protein
MSCSEEIGSGWQLVEHHDRGPPSCTPSPAGLPCRLLHCPRSDLFRTAVEEQEAQLHRHASTRRNVTVSSTAPPLIPRAKKAVLV